MYSSAILVDHRENNGALPYLENDIEKDNNLYSSKSSKFGGGKILFKKINNCKIGDYAITLACKTQNKTLLAACIERKTWKDLAASIKDTRARNQHVNMEILKNKTGCRLFYIIEGATTFNSERTINGIKFKALHAKLRSWSISGIPFFQTRTPQQTSLLIIKLARDFTRLYHCNYLNFPLQTLLCGGNPETPENPNSETETETEIKNSEHPLEVLKNKIQAAITKYAESQESPDIVTRKTNFLISNYLTTNQELPHVDFNVPICLTEKTEKPLLQIKLNVWNSIPGVSELTSSVLNSKYKLADFIVQNTSLIPELAEVQRTSGTKIGIAAAKKITNAVTQNNILVKMLESLPGISKTKSQIILAAIPVLDLMSGKISKTQLSNVKINKRNLGKAATEKIFSVFQIL